MGSTILSRADSVLNGVINFSTSSYGSYTPSGSTSWWRVSYDYGSGVSVRAADYPAALDSASDLFSGANVFNSSGLLGFMGSDMTAQLSSLTIDTGGGPTYLTPSRPIHPVCV